MEGHCRLKTKIYKKYNGFIHFMLQQQKIGQLNKGRF